MNLSEALRVALRALAANKLRSVLTMLGIIIGVGAVITLLSVGRGVERYVTDQFQSIGSNLLFAVPGQLTSGGPPRTRANTGSSLTMRDVMALRDTLRVPDVMAVAPEVSRVAAVKAGKREITPQIGGVEPEYAAVRNWVVEAGRFITPEDVTAHARVAVIGQTVVTRLFPEEENLANRTIEINDVAFRIVGVLQKRGGSGFGDEDNQIFVPITTAQSRLFPSRTPSGDYRVSVIYLQATAEDRMEAAASQITDVLRETHSITYSNDDDFSVVSQADLINIFGQITGVLTLFLGAIAAISLLVGGIGIMNIMLVSVTERTREIGIRKAVGAKRRDILAQFLLEAVVLSLIGGFVGIGLGASGAAAVSSLQSDFQTFVTLDSVALATGFSAAVGLFFGIYPATRAARLNPIDALRYE
ncbi:MAG: ABC transporter permease [Anaerolineae bacterium]